MPPSRIASVYQRHTLSNSWLAILIIIKNASITRWMKLLKCFRVWFPHRWSNLIHIFLARLCFVNFISKSIRRSGKKLSQRLASIASPVRSSYPTAKAIDLYLLHAYASQLRTENPSERSLALSWNHKGFNGRCCIAYALVTDLGFYLWVCTAKKFLMQFGKPYIIW